METTVKKLLILDDDPMLGQTFKVMAERGGWSARHTSDPDEFFSLLESWQPHSVAVDLIMPGMDGVQVIGELAHRDCKASIIISSGAEPRVLEAARRSAREHGLQIAGVLSKPFTRKVLLDLLGNHTAQTTPTVSSMPAQRKARDLGVEDLQQAIDNREIFVVMQPKVFCRNGVLAGFEALARWNHKEVGMVRPDVFIELAEQVGLIDPLTEQVMEQALSWLAQLPNSVKSEPGLEGLETRLSSLILSINISARSLGNMELFRNIADRCSRLGIRRDRIILELTETSAMEDPLASLDILTSLRVQGFKLSIDDFGTGYSSMKQLVRLPFSEIKVDRSFVMSARESRESRTITRSIIELGHSLSLSTTAEGIEDQETLDYLREIGCELGQGFHIAKPMDLNVLSQWILDYVRESEARRLAELKALNIMDTAPEARFDRHTHAARMTFGTPIALISFVSKNRQWLKSHPGLDDNETSRDISFCTHAISTEGFFQVEDATRDERFQNNPLVTGDPGIRYYAGFPIRGPSGYNVGAFCIIDTKRRVLSSRDIERLRTMALDVEAELGAHVSNNIDALTGTLTATGFEGHVRSALNHARNLNLPTATVEVRLTNLNSINKHFGFDEGNHAMVKLGELLQAMLRRSDLIGRVSGSAFRTFLIDVNNRQVLDLCTKLERQIRELNASLDNYDVVCEIAVIEIETVPSGNVWSSPSDKPEQAANG